MCSWCSHWVVSAVPLPRCVPSERDLEDWGPQTCMNRTHTHTYLVVTCCVSDVTCSDSQNHLGEDVKWHTVCTKVLIGGNNSSPITLKVHNMCIHFMCVHTYVCTYIYVCTVVIHIIIIVRTYVCMYIMCNSLG